MILKFFQNISLEKDIINLYRFKKNMYSTSNSDYNPNSLIPPKTQIQNYSQIGRDMPNHAKFLKLYKNQNVA